MPRINYQIGVPLPSPSTIDLIRILAPNGAQFDPADPMVGPNPAGTEAEREFHIWVDWTSVNDQGRLWSVMLTAYCIEIPGMSRCITKNQDTATYSWRADIDNYLSAGGVLSEVFLVWPLNRTASLTYLFTLWGNDEWSATPVPMTEWSKVWTET